MNKSIFQLYFDAYMHADFDVRSYRHIIPMQQENMKCKSLYFHLERVERERERERENGKRK